MQFFYALDCRGVCLLLMVADWSSCSLVVYFLEYFTNCCKISLISGTLCTKGRSKRLISLLFIN